MTGTPAPGQPQDQDPVDPDGGPGDGGSGDGGTGDGGSGDGDPLARDPSRVDLGSSGEYGLDAPGIVAKLSYVALGSFAVMLVAGLVNVAFLMAIALVIGVFFTIAALALVSSSRVAKLRERVRIVEAAGLSRDDYVLDVGCGRGLLLVEAARSVPDGLAVGVDVWSSTDQSRNVPSAPLDNAVIERVDDRVEVVTGDGRRLPYVDGAFDAVISSMVVHNIADSAGRARVIREAVRVLRPGGRLVVVDMRRTTEYVAVLRALRWSDVSRSRRVWRMMPPVRYVSGTKPNPGSAL